MRGRSSAAEVAEAIAAEGGARAYRALLQLADDLAAVDAGARVALSAEEPVAEVGRWLDAIAGIVEMRLREVGAPAPVWVVACGGDPGSKWEPDRGVTLPEPADEVLVPEPLRRRGVMIEASELRSV